MILLLGKDSFSPKMFFKTVGLSKKTPTEIERVFKILDQDKSGFIEQDELQLSFQHKQLSYIWMYTLPAPSIIHVPSWISPKVVLYSIMFLYEMQFIWHVYSFCSLFVACVYFFLNVVLRPRSSSDCSCRTSPKERDCWLQLRPELSCWRETRMETGRSAGKVDRPEGN